MGLIIPCPSHPPDGKFSRPMGSKFPSDRLSSEVQPTWLCYFGAVGCRKCKSAGHLLLRPANYEYSTFKLLLSTKEFFTESRVKNYYTYVRNKK